jgi:hypothetical protein
MRLPAAVVLFRGNKSDEKRFFSSEKCFGFMAAEKVAGKRGEATFVFYVAVLFRHP